MSTINEKVELSTNILIGVAAIALIGFLAQQFLSTTSKTPTQPEQAHPTIGKRVSLPDIDFSTSPKTLVMVLQTTCHFCNESMPFYRRLAEQVKGKGVRLVAVFPTTVDEGVRHLAEWGITQMEVRQADLSVLDSSGTPTLILTNDQGEVVNYWIGKLRPEKEIEVLDQISS